jgi:hypothetical protein
VCVCVSGGARIPPTELTGGTLGFVRTGARRIKVRHSRTVCSDDWAQGCCSLPCGEDSRDVLGEPLPGGSGIDGPEALCYTRMGGSFCVGVQGSCASLERQELSTFPLAQAPHGVGRWPVTPQCRLCRPRRRVERDLGLPPNPDRRAPSRMA